MTETFTQKLLALDHEGLQRVTEHPFLTAAAQGALPEQQLIQWLAQDRLYALSYVPFIGQLLGKINIPTTSNRPSTLRWRLSDCLIDCLTNIRRELDLFEDTAAQYNWSHVFDTAEPRGETQAYKDLFAGAAQPSASLLKGFVTLWATEMCYLDAWTFASKGMKPGAKGVMPEVFIPNWSSPDFEYFVHVLEVLVNEVALGASSEDKKEAELVFRQVLQAEEAFWPSV